MTGKGGAGTGLGLSTLRTVAGFASAVPAGYLGLATGALHRDKRAGVDAALPVWLDTLFLSTGVRLSVQGGEHLWDHRPAVFLFNHRNNFDVLMAAKLVRTSFTAVGKAEARSNPISAGLGWLIDAAFIDRSDATQAVNAMRPVEDAVARGLSLIISPEGTRSRTGEILPFKKGPFRIAMAAGVPVVPIVFRNADDVAARSGRWMEPATVDTVVLPPIAVGGWTLDQLPDRIAGVRQRYVDTLADWPVRDRRRATLRR